MPSVQRNKTCCNKDHTTIQCWQVKVICNGSERYGKDVNLTYVVQQHQYLLKGASVSTKYITVDVYYYNIVKSYHVTYILQNRLPSRIVIQITAHIIPG